MVSAGRISLKQLTLDVMLRNLTKFLTTCLVFHSPLSDVEKSRPRKVLRFLVLLLCKQFSLCFSLVMRAIWWANVADSDFIFRRISFRYWWESAKQYNISRMYLQLSTKLSQKCLKMIKIVFWKWFVGGFRCFRRFLIDLANSMYPPKKVLSLRLSLLKVILWSEAPSMYVVVHLWLMEWNRNYITSFRLAE